MCVLKAEALEKDKEFRQKLQMQQKTHADMVESLQVSRSEKTLLMFVLFFNCNSLSD